jgi:hypothetical protein
MRKSMLALAVSAFAAFFGNGAAMASFIPPTGLAPGSEYQLLFVTSGTTQALNQDVNNYNNFVTNQAALNPALPSTTWHAIVTVVSPSEVITNAAANAPSQPGIPVYDTRGELLTNLGLYTENPLDAVPVFDENGLPGPTPGVWTGSTPLGTYPGIPYNIGADGSGPIQGLNNEALGSGWLSGSAPNNPAEFESLYGLSAPILVSSPTPEPATLTLLTSAFLTAGAFGVGRRRRA